LKPSALGCVRKRVEEKRDALVDARRKKAGGKGFLQREKKHQRLREAAHERNNIPLLQVGLSGKGGGPNQRTLPVLRRGKSEEKPKRLTSGRGANGK